jgi:LPPG:FO 2-phospho-L-lactate transferase
MRIVALCGGVGGAKLAEGLQRSVAPGRLQLIVNTGDDFEHRGMPICPDLDTVLYTLAGVANAQQGWGRADETWQVHSQWREMGLDTWFQLGDRDIALHLHRREMQAQGMTLTQISLTLAREFGVPSALLPMCDAPAPTTVLTDRGEMPFQEYFVKHRCVPAVRGFRYGAEAGGQVTLEVRRALEDPDLEGIILCPSNPYLSIAPILAVNGLRELLARTDVPVLAVSPIVGGAAIKGPAAKIMRELGLPVSPLTIARQYRDFLDVMLIDEADSSAQAARETADPALEIAPILMRTLDERRALGETCLKLLSREKQANGIRPRASSQGRGLEPTE